MPGNARQFAAQLLRESEDFTDGNFRDFRDKLVFEALNIISETWPVDTGFSRAGNLPFVGSPDNVPLPGGSSGGSFGDFADAGALQMADSVLGGSDPYETAGVATAVIYAPALEAGHSAQSSHMYERARMALERVVESVR